MSDVMIDLLFALGLPLVFCAFCWMIFALSSARALAAEMSEDGRPWP